MASTPLGIEYPAGESSVVWVARRTREGSVVLLLEPREAHVVDADESEQLRRQRAGRVVALRNREEADPRQAHRLDLAGDVAVDLTLDVDERAVRAEGLLHVAGLQAEQRRQLAGLGDRVGHVGGIRVDVRGLFREGERDPVAVEDLAALGREVERAHALLHPQRGERALVPDLQERQADADRHEGQHDGDQHGHQPCRRWASQRSAPTPATGRITTSRGSTIPRAAAHSAMVEGADSVATSLSSDPCWTWRSSSVCRASSIR